MSAKQIKTLKDILHKVPIQTVLGSTELAIKKIEFDSLKVSDSDLFVAIKGHTVDGHNFIEKAIDQGASAVICQKIPDVTNDKISYLKVEDSNQALAILAANFYDNPSESIKLIGTTGTNGKTTISTLLFQLFKKMGYKVGLFSTVKIQINNTEYKATHTTPDSLTINRYLSMMHKADVAYCFMEVSSHGIHQKRAEALHFTGGIFTNLSHEHLDYHNSFAEYRDIKKSFFDHLPKQAFALTNKDDKNGMLMVQNTKAKVATYGLKTYADFSTQVLENGFDGQLLKLNGNEVWTKLIGNYNAYNFLAIYAAAILLGAKKTELLKILSNLESVPGRFQYKVFSTKIIVIVDYAHTPDALTNVLSTVNQIRKNKQQLITVLGCGGDRDAKKRPKMAHISVHHSDMSIFTSDNPRNEDPQAIINDMEKGIEPDNMHRTISVLDRKQAIKTACQMAQPNDIVLIAGKGHETYQEIKGKRFDFNDLEIANEILNQLKK